MTQKMILLPLVLTLGACAQVDALSDRFMRKDAAVADAAPADPFKAESAGTESAVLAPETAAPPPPAAATTAEALDTTTAAQRAAATAAPETTGRALGTTVVALGSPTDPGLWLKTLLVQAEAQGRVTNPATGQSSKVTLIPLGGAATAGSQLSLAAMRLIGASLTDLTTVEVALEG